MMKRVPDVSVVIAAYNEEIYVREAIDSILAQTGPEIELIVVDDHSTDSTPRIVEDMARADNRIRFVRSPKKGKVAAFNYGVSLASGQWLCIFAGDDLMPEDSLGARYDAVKEHTDGTPLIGMCRLVTLSEDASLNGQIIPRNPNKTTFSGVCYLMNRAAVSAIWPVPEELPNEDTWLELAAQYLDIPYVSSPVIGCAWRLHSGNSINMLIGFSEFNRKYTVRMVANELFFKRYGESSSSKIRKILAARVACEDARKRGDIFGILMSGVGPIAALRAVSLSGPNMYAVRRRFYKLFSGW